MSPEERTILKKLSTPIKIQDFLDTLEIGGAFYTSALRTLHARKARCFEGALLAAFILSFHGEKPLLLDLKAASPDFDHVVALYRKNGYWGAVSKTNYVSLRFRDPVYKTIRELALSYFHEYFVNKTGKKTLRSYSKPFNLNKQKIDWIASEKKLDDLAIVLDESPHFPLFPKKNLKYIRKADKMERKAGEIVEWGD